MSRHLFIGIALWIGRAVACIFILFGVLVLGSTRDPGVEDRWALFGVLGVGGGILTLIGIDTAHHGWATTLRVVGWLSMVAFTAAVPSSLDVLRIPAALVVLGLPAVILASRDVPADAKPVPSDGGV